MLLVRLTGLEPAFLAEMEPKSIVSANFTTGAYTSLYQKKVALSRALRCF